MTRRVVSQLKSIAAAMNVQMPVIARILPILLGSIAAVTVTTAGVAQLGELALPRTPIAVACLLAGKIIRASVPILVMAALTTILPLMKHGSAVVVMLVLPMHL